MEMEDRGVEKGRGERRTKIGRERRKKIGREREEGSG